MSDTVAIDREALEIHQTDRHGEPLNAEVDAKELTKSLVTPTAKIFHRNHADIVQVPREPQESVESEWKLCVSVEEDIQRLLPGATYSYGDLLRGTGACEGVEQLDVMATLECAGNRRKGLSEIKDTEGIQWNDGAISTASWQGPSIRSLLLHQGFPDPYGHHSLDERWRLVPSAAMSNKDSQAWARSLHLHMLSAQPLVEDEELAASASVSHNEDMYFGASIPLNIVMHPAQQCLIATRQNNQLLTQAHGFPLRAVVPGHIGARWVKWLRGLHVSTRANESEPMKDDYKLLVPPLHDEATWQATVDDAEGRKSLLEQQEPMQSMGVGSAIERPRDGACFSGRSIDVRGYAVGQHGSPVSRVEVMLLEQNGQDEDTSSIRKRASERTSGWQDAVVELSTPSDGQPSWAWSLWHANVALPANRHDAQNLTIIARATTRSGVVQDMQSPWNVRGFSERSWPVVRHLSRAQDV